MNEAQRLLLKSFGYTDDQIEAMAAMQTNIEKEDGEKHILIQFAKDAIGPQDLAVSGEITASRANKFIDLITSQDDLLKRVNIIPMDSLKSTYDVWDMDKGVLVRVAEGSEPTNAKKKKISNKGRELDSKPMQLFADVTRASILNNQHRPNFISWLDGRFAKKFSNELIYLGFVGEKDDYANSDFKNLNKGWLQIVNDEADANKTTYAAEDSMVDRLQKLVDTADDDLPDDAKIFIHRKDFLKYCIEVGKSTNTAELLIQAAAQGFAGYEFVVTNNMPSGTYMLTPLQNLVIGVVSKIYRNREWNSRKRAVEYTFDIHADYDIAVPKFASLATQAA